MSGEINGNGNGNGFSAFLRDASKYALAALIAVAAWNLRSVIDQGERIKALETQMNPVTGNRYTRTDALEDRDKYDVRFRELEERVSVVEREMPREK